MIELNELTKYFDARKAVGPLSVRIEQGEVVGLLGLNGAGKTTTLRMLSSDLLPTSGTMMVDGVDLVTESDKVRPKIGYLPDRPPLYPEMEVREYLRFAAQLRGMPKAKINARVSEVIEQTSLTEHADDLIGTLSHGYRQRVGIGQAIVHQPSLLLLDEPISGLDPVQIVEMRALVRSLRGEHTTVLSSHILSEISETCDRLLVIRDGEIVASGTEAELSSQLAAGFGLELLLRAPSGAPNFRSDGEEKGEGLVRELLLGIDGVLSATDLPDTEEGEGLLRLRVAATHDVREELCRSLVKADIGILGLERSAKELESVFMALTDETGEQEATS